MIIISDRVSRDLESDATFRLDYKLAYHHYFKGVYGKRGSALIERHDEAIADGRSLCGRYRTERGIICIETEAAPGESDKVVSRIRFEDEPTPQAKDGQ